MFKSKNRYAPRLNPQDVLLSRIAASNYEGRGRSNNFNHAEGDVILPVVSSGQPSNSLGKVGQGMYNPKFIAQIQLRMLKLYYTEVGGVYTPILPAALGAGLNVSLPFFLFLNLDFAAGYAQLKQKFPQPLWVYNAPVVWGKDQPLSSTRPLANGKWDAGVTALLRDGDVIIPFTATVGGINYVAFTIVRANDIAYASLLSATDSNTFGINLVRFKVALGQEAQFANSVVLANETMFGKVTTDPVNPESFQSPQDQQPNILDMDVQVDINKQKGIASAANFDVVALTWNVFIDKTSKIV